VLESGNSAIDPERIPNVAYPLNGTCAGHIDNHQTMPPQFIGNTTVEHIEDAEPVAAILQPSQGQAP